MFAALFRATYRKRMKALDGIPGPTPTFPLGNGKEFLGSPPWAFKPPWQVCADFKRDHGPITLIWMFGQPMLVLNDATLVRQVLEDEHEQFYKRNPIPALRPLTPADSLFLSNDEEWRHLREHHPFASSHHNAWLDALVGPLAEYTGGRIDDLIQGSNEQPIDLVASLQRLSFDAFAIAVAGKTLGDQAYRDFCFMGNVGARRVRMPVVIGPPRDPRFYAARRRWNAVFAELIKTAEAASYEACFDLLATLPRQSTGLTSQAYRVLVSNIFYGGVYSVTSGIVSTLGLLNRDPDAAEMLASELSGLSGGFDRRALERCEFLDCVLREALRLLPPVPIFLRDVRKDRTVKLAGHTIPGGTSIAITTWALHRDATHWPNPTSFDPQRWKNATATNPLGSGHFFPFGRGPRTCIGQEFSMLFMKLALTAILCRAKVTDVAPWPYQQHFHFGVMLPKKLRGVIAAR